MRTIAATLALLAVAGAAQAKDVKAGPLTISGQAVRSTAGAPTTAAYMTIANAGKTPDKLVSVDCACAAMAMMHVTESKGGVSSMSMVNDVAIPAGGKVTFRPDGLHVMIAGLKAPLKAGGTVTLSLKFEKAGLVKAPFPVVDSIPLSH